MKTANVCRALVVILALTSGVRAVEVQVTGGTTFIGLDPQVLTSLQLITSEQPPVYSAEVDTLTMPPLAGFPINGRDMGTTAAYNTETFPASLSGVFAHHGSVAFPAAAAEVGNFVIGFNAERVSATRSGFFATTMLANELSGAPLFDVAADGLSAEALADSFKASGKLLISAELAAILDAPIAGMEIGQISMMATAVPEPTGALLALLALAWLAPQCRSVAATRRDAREV